jgi:hypothetical protein
MDQILREPQEEQSRTQVVRITYDHKWSLQNFNSGSASTNIYRSAFVFLDDYHPSDTCDYYFQYYDIVSRLYYKRLSTCK